MAQEKILVVDDEESMVQFLTVLLRREGYEVMAAPSGPEALKRLQEVAASGGNVFAELMDSVKVASLGQISHALYQVGGQYRRNM